MDTRSVARDKTAPLARMEMHVLFGHVARQLPHPAPARPKAVPCSLHAHLPAGLEQNLRPPPMLLLRHAFNSFRRPRSVQQYRMQKLCRGQRRHGNRVMGRRRRYSQCAPSTSQSVPVRRFSASMSVSGRTPRTCGRSSAMLVGDIGDDNRGSCKLIVASSMRG